MTYRVAVVGLSHDHVWAEVPHWLAHPSVDIMAVCEADQKLTQRADAEWGVECAYPSLEELLEHNYPDICLLFGSNRVAADQAVQLLQRQIHVLIEKPLASNLAQAEALWAASRSSQAELMVNWPEWWYPSYQIGEAMLRRQAIGPLRSARIRMAHRGPRQIGCSESFCRWLYDEEENGAGALYDYGGYGVAASLSLMGRPRSVSATLFQDEEEAVDTEAIITLSYGSGLVQCEASWRAEPPAREHTFFGEWGTVWLERDNLWVQTAESERIHLKPGEGDVPFTNAAQCFVTHLDEQKKVDGIFGLSCNVDVISVLDAAKRSAAQGSCQVEPRWIA